MTDTINAISRFEAELHAAGIADRFAIPTIFVYIAALQSNNEDTWRAFYISVYERLCELAQREYSYVGRAAEPLLRLLDDDLGSTLVSAGERARIRERLVEDGISEASLSS